MTLRADLVCDAAGLEALRPEWQALWLRVPHATPFHSPAWLLPWWRAFGEGAPLVLAIRSRTELVGLVPLYCHRDGESRKLLPLGAGISDYMDPLIDPAQDAAALALEVLDGQTSGFDRIDLTGQRDGSPFLEVPLPSCFRRSISADAPAPVLDLAAGPPKSRLAKLPYYHRRAERIGPVRFAWATPDTRTELLQALFDLHSARWNRRGEAGVLADPRLQSFHDQASSELLRLGLLRLVVLRLGGHPAAAFYGFSDGRRWYAYISGFDSSLPHPGLGAMLLGHVVQTAETDGASELHFLRGTELYKYSWGALDRPLWTVSFRLYGSENQDQR